MKCMRYSSLFLIILQWVQSTYQQCLNTTRIKGSLWAFSLAQVNDLSNPIGPQEACYWSCGGQIVTHSANKGNMDSLTLMDKSVTILAEMGFLTGGQVYLLNHLGLSEEEGGNGIGCLQVLPGGKTNSYPRSHPVCSKAKVAVCGFWGEQQIPNRDNSTLVTQLSSISLSSSSTIVNSPATTTTESEWQPTWRASTTQQQRQFSTGRPRAMTGSTTTSLPVATPPVAIDTKDNASHDSVVHFEANDIQYHVVTYDAQSANDASIACAQNNAKLSDITSQKYDQIAIKLKALTASGRKMVIGFWNNDSYSFSGDDCLILQVNYGIYPGKCSESTAVLCSS